MWCLLLISAWVGPQGSAEASNPLSLMLKARFAMVSGAYDQAINLANAVIADHPDLAEAVHLRIEARLEQQNERIIAEPEQQARLVQEMMEAAVRFPEDYRFPKMIGVLLVSNPRWRQLPAMETPDRYLNRAVSLLEADGEDRQEELSDTYYYLGRWYRLKENFFDAALSFAEVCALSPDTAWAWYYAGQAFEYSHQLRTARRYYQRFVELGNQMYWQGRPLVEINIAAINVVLDPSPENIQALESVFQLREPDSITLLHNAERFIKAGLYPLSKSILERLPKEAHGPRYRGMWSQILMATHRYDDVLAFSNQELYKQLESNDRVRVVDNALQAAIMSGQYDDAYSLISRFRDVPGMALRLDLMTALLDTLRGADTDAWQNLVQRHGGRDFVRLLEAEARDNGLYVVAAKYVAQLFIAREDYFGARNFLLADGTLEDVPFGLQEEVAITYVMTGEVDRAFEIYDKLVTEKPDRVDLLNNLGFFLADQGHQLERAEAMISKALASDETNSAFLDSMGWVQFRLGNFIEARRFLEAALRTDKDDPEKLEHMGDIVYALGEETLAKRYWSRAIEHGERRFMELLEKLDPAP